MTHRAIAVFLKELVDNARDRRSLGTAFFFSLMGPLLLIPLLAFQASSFDRGGANLINIPVQGAERAPGLVEFLRQRNIDVHAAPEDPAQAVRDLKANLVLVVPPGYADDFRAGRPAAIRIVTDHSRTTAAGEIGRVEGALETYSQTVGALRLVARGVSPNVVSAVAIEIDDVATPESEGALLLAIVPMFLMMSVFFGGLYVAVDVTAGERERGSLEPLMATPIGAADIVLGKLAAVIFFSFTMMAIALVGFAVVINLPFAEIPGLRFKLSPLGALEIFVALVPVLLPAAALQMLVASRCRSVKEAMTAASFCSMIPMVPGMLTVFSPFKSTTSAMMVPLFGQNLIMNQILRAAPLAALDYTVAGVVTTALGVALAAAAVAQCAHARMLANR